MKPVVVEVAYNEKHGITPQTIVKKIHDIQQGSHKPRKKIKKDKIPPEEIKRLINELNNKMDIASQNLEFEKASELRDQIEDLKEGLK